MRKLLLTYAPTPHPPPTEKKLCNFFFLVTKISHLSLLQSDPTLFRLGFSPNNSTES